MKDKIIDASFFVAGLVGIVFTLSFIIAVVKSIYIIIKY